MTVSLHTLTDLLDPPTRRDGDPPTHLRSGVVVTASPLVVTVGGTDTPAFALTSAGVLLPSDEVQVLTREGDVLVLGGVA